MTRNDALEDKIIFKTNYKYFDLQQDIAHYLV